MLHPVPDSSKRARLLEVVELQRQLIENLCARPEGSTVDLPWLKGIWPTIPPSWVERFWNLPADTKKPGKPGKRSIWIATIAAAKAAEKQTLRDLTAEQLRFAELYHCPPSIRLTKYTWTPYVFEAANELLKSFYAPLFYKDEGFQGPTGDVFNKDDFISGFTPRVKICPYTDNVIQDTKLDHFLPKDQFPMLSCHPDNLIPCGTDANSGSHKGTEFPLDPAQPDQAGSWFHPRWRTARGTYKLDFPKGTAPQPRVVFVAISAPDQPRLDNMARMFGLSDFWGGFLDDEVQNLASDVQGWIEDDAQQPTEARIKEYVQRRAKQERKRIGRDGLAIVKSYFYEHIAQTPVLLAQVVRACTQGT